VRHAVLKVLFSRASDDERHISLLTKFLSMAVGVKNSNVLNSAAVWMQVWGLRLMSKVGGLVPPGAFWLK
jgi:hypothetical protein